jgi:hypothetical protein
MKVVLSALGLMNAVGPSEKQGPTKENPNTRHNYLQFEVNQPLQFPVVATKVDTTPPEIAAMKKAPADLLGNLIPSVAGFKEEL